MFNVGGGEIVVILLIALIVLGPDKLPNAARQVGKYLNEFRRISSGFQDELRSAMEVASTTDQPPASTPVERAPIEATTVEPPAPDETHPGPGEARPGADDAGPAGPTAA